MNPNQLAGISRKTSCAEFTKKIHKTIHSTEWHPYGQLYVFRWRPTTKTLNFVINNQAYLDAILTCGERVTVPACFHSLRRAAVICM